LFAENSTQWKSWLRSIAGVRLDYYNFNVDSSLPVNSGKLDATITSPKLSFIFGPWYKTELFLNGGYGYHSNDARGTVIVEDPQTHLPAAPVTPLVRTKGAELGMRTQMISNVES